MTDTVTGDAGVSTTHCVTHEPDDPRILLIWDAPNLDMGLGAILGSRPTAQYRPRFDALGRWLLDRTNKYDTPIIPEATVFTNVATQGSDVIRPWVEALRNIGYAVFAKPKITEDSDVDQDMVAHINYRFNQGHLREVIVASADGQNFRETLEKLVDHGIKATVIGFHEHASWAIQAEKLQFIDLEEIPGVFQKPLPRISLDSLPEQGAWLQPFRPLTSLLNPRRDEDETTC